MSKPTLRLVDPSDPPSPGAEHDDFVSLLTAHQSSLRAYITSLMPGDSQINDVLQETNLTLWKKREKFQLGSNFTAWSFAVARFSVKEHRARHRRDQQRVVFSDALLESISLAADTAEPDRINERQTALERCLTKLSDADRAIIRARYTRGDSLEKHSDKSGRSAGSLRVSLFRIRAALRKCIRRETSGLSTFRPS